MTTPMSNASPDPALAAVSKQVVTLQADITNLRKGMVQQLTLSGKLIKAVFALDNDYFGGRFQGQQNQDNPDPFRDFTVATKVVEAVSEELQGASAFADSPVLRDGIANLITALESTRGIALEMEKSGIEAVGLPVKPEGMKARVFPENNPPGCLAEAAGSVHDLSAMMARTRDRFSAMRMMMNEAERARSEAESVVTPVNVEKIAAAVSDELKKVQQELKTTRAQLMATLDSHALAEKALRAELERARREAAYEFDTRKADRAEARSLAAEIARQVENSMPKGRNDDLEITLSVLREALSEDQDIASLAAATEGVVVDWVRLTAQQATKPAAAAPVDQGRIAALEKELAAAKAAGADAAKASSDAVKAATEKAAAEAAALKAKLAEVERRATTAEQDLVKLKDRAGQAAAAESAELTALKVKLAEAETGIATREREAKEAKDAVAAAGRKATELQQQFDAQKAQSEAVAKTAQQGVDANNRDVAALRAQLLQATTTLRLKEDEAKRARESLQQEQAKHGDAFQNLTRQLNATQEKLAVTTSELQGTRTQAADLTKQLAEVSARATQGREAELKQVREVHARELKQAVDAKVIAETRLQQLEATAKQGDAQRGAEIGEARKTITSLEARVTEAQSKVEVATAEATRLKGELGRLGAEHAKTTASLEFATGRERQLGSDRERLERERAELQARLDALRKTSDATVSQSEQTLGSLKKQLAESQAAEAEVRSQLARLTTETKALGDKHGKGEQELSAVRSEKDRLAAAIQGLTQERDQARLKLSEIERERARQTEAVGRAEAQVRTLTADMSTLKRTEQEATVRADKLTAELAQVRERLAAAQQSGAQAVAQQSALKDLEARLTNERDTARTSATTASSERDRLKAQLDRVQADHEALAKSSQEREGQITSRLNEVTRQLAELKQDNTRLAADGERLQAEAARAAAARNDAKEALERKDSTSTWTKRLADSSAQVDQARARAAELERRVEEQRHQLAQFEERLARQSQAEVHLRERVGEVEKRESSLQKELASTKAESEQARGRLNVLENELAAAKTTAIEAEARRERQKVRFDALMREARTEVASAVKQMQQLEADGQGKATIISDLMKQLQELRLRSGTNG
jgi:ParB family chromosome partitioning protein